MDLTVKDRVLLLTILPKEGDITTVRLVRDLRAELSFSEEEHTRLQFVTGENGVSWTDGGLKKEIVIGPRAHLLIADTLKQLNTQKKLTSDFLDLYDAFVETE